MQRTYFGIRKGEGGRGRCSQEVSWERPWTWSVGGGAGAVLQHTCTCLMILNIYRHCISLLVSICLEIRITKPLPNNYIFTQSQVDHTLHCSRRIKKKNDNSNDVRASVGGTCILHKPASQHVDWFTELLIGRQWLRDRIALGFLWCARFCSLGLKKAGGSIP